jgi:Zn-dependent oligopeptidase
MIIYNKKSGVKSKEQGGIFINPENKGKFTAAAKRANMGVQEFANKVLSNKEDYSSTTVKRANFARNANKWEK